jgi:hypothetical protein
MKHDLSEMGLKRPWPAIPSVRGIRVASRAQLPAVPTVVIVLELVEAPVEPETPKEVMVEAPSPRPPAAKPREVPVQVIPPRRKRERRAPKVEEAPAPPPTPKPLKVIRRRKEEAPKVFETPPKEFPEAILSGFHLRPDDDPGK